MNGSEFWLLIAFISLGLLIAYKLDKRRFLAYKDYNKRQVVSRACASIKNEYGIYICRTGEGFTISNPVRFRYVYLGYNSEHQFFFKREIRMGDKPLCETEENAIMNQVVEKLNKALQVENGK